jgi:hypothetical protein
MIKRNRFWYCASDWANSRSGPVVGFPHSNVEYSVDITQCDFTNSEPAIILTTLFFYYDLYDHIAMISIENCHAGIDYGRHM